MSSIQNLQGATSAAALAASISPTSQSAVPKELAADQKPKSADTDTVQISSAARAALTQSSESPIQEARETPAQTAREAAGGDQQAKHLLAQRAATQKLFTEQTQAQKT